MQCPNLHVVLRQSSTSSHSLGSSMYVVDNVSILSNCVQLKMSPGLLSLHLSPNADKSLSDAFTDQILS